MNGTNRIIIIIMMIIMNGSNMIIIMIMMMIIRNILNGDKNIHDYNEWDNVIMS